MLNCLLDVRPGVQLNPSGISIFFLRMHITMYASLYAYVQFSFIKSGGMTPIIHFPAKACQPVALDNIANRILISSDILVSYSSRLTLL